MARPRRRSVRWLILVVSLVVAVVAPGAQVDEEGSNDTTAGRLVIRAILIDDDLELKPIAKREFRLCPDESCDEPIAVVTSFSGEASVEVPPGEYRIRIAEALKFGDKVFAWDESVQIEAESEHVVELSNDNAVIAEVSGERNLRGPTEEGQLYAKYRAGVFRVDSERGHGSGFLVVLRGISGSNFARTC